jgi:hypothetical protein
MEGYKSRRINRGMNGKQQTCRWRQTDRWMDGKTDLWLLDRQINGRQTDGLTDLQMNGQKNRWIDEQMGGQTDVQTEES